MDEIDTDFQENVSRQLWSVKSAITVKTVEQEMDDVLWLCFVWVTPPRHRNEIPFMVDN